MSELKLGIRSIDPLGSFQSKLWHRLLGSGQILQRNPVALIGASIILIVVFLAITAPILPLHDPAAQPGHPLLRPGQGFILGTDEFGRDVLSRLIWGTRSSLFVALVSVSIAIAVGATAGILAGYYGSWLDNLLMRIMDILFSLPAIILAITITSILGPGLTNAVIALGIVYAPVFARIARAPTLGVVNLPYVEAARSIGASDRRIVLHHVVPNITGSLIVQTTISLSAAILIEAALSFLGLGTQPPMPSWGLMLYTSRQYMLIDPWIAILPGVAIAVTVLGFNLLGDGLRDILDPRTRAK